jgi:hypothetical protein
VPGAGVALAAGFAAAILLCALFNDGWVPLLDSANLALHEAGHPLFGILSERLAVYGGTLMQLVFPAACLVEFRRRRETLSLAMCWIWLAENLLNIARYMADARAQLLPLVGGEDVLHDWNTILARWRLLQKDVVLANCLRVLAWLLIASALAYLVVRWRRSRQT